MTSRKILVQTTKWSTSSKIPNFQNGEKLPWCLFSYVGSKFKCLQLMYRWKGNCLKKWGSKLDMFRYSIERNQKDIFLKL